MCSVLLCKSTCGACGKFSFEPNNQEQIAACTFRLQKPHDKQKPASCCCCSEKLTGQAATPSLSNTFSKHKERGGPAWVGEKNRAWERKKKERLWGESMRGCWGGGGESENRLKTVRTSGCCEHWVRAARVWTTDKEISTHQHREGNNFLSSFLFSILVRSRGEDSIHHQLELFLFTTTFSFGFVLNGRVDGGCPKTPSNPFISPVFMGFKREDWRKMRERKHLCKLSRQLLHDVVQTGPK